jgi:hypothetical protein
MASIGWVELVVILGGAFLLVLSLAILAAVVLLARRQKLAHADLKKCPFCAELIKAEAKVCRYCGRDVPISD